MAVYDVFAEMDEDVEAAKNRQKGGNGTVFFFKVGDGERAIVRPLLNLNQCARVWKHEQYNVAANKYEVSALCTRSLDGDPDGAECQHCKDGLAMTRYYILPVYLYGIQDKDGNKLTYQDKQNNETRPQSGLRFIQMKGTSPLLAALREEYADLEAGDSFIKHDVSIKCTYLGGDRKKQTFHVKLAAARPFSAPDGVELPDYSSDPQDTILAALMETWKPAYIVSRTPATPTPADDDYDPFGDAPTTTVPPASARKKVNNGPEF